MKIKVLGKEHKEGKSKKTGNEYSFNVIYYNTPRNGVEGVAADSTIIDPQICPLRDIVIGKDYNLDFDSRGYLVAFAPV